MFGERVIGEGSKESNLKVGSTPSNFRKLWSRSPLDCEKLARKELVVGSHACAWTSTRCLWRNTSKYSQAYSGPQYLYRPVTSGSQLESWTKLNIAYKISKILHKHQCHSWRKFEFVGPTLFKSPLDTRWDINKWLREQFGFSIHLAISVCFISYKKWVQT